LNDEVGQRSGESPTKEGEGGSGGARPAFGAVMFARELSAATLLSPPSPSPFLGRSHQLGTFGFRQDSAQWDSKGLIQTPLALRCCPPKAACNGGGDILVHTFVSEENGGL